MAKLSLEQLKAAFSPQAKTQNASSWKSFYPFWKMEMDQQAVVRFLPDLNPENPMGFMVENITHKITINGQQKTIPCLTMYGESCPCCELARKYYDTEGDNSVNGKKYYKKREYLGQILINSSPFEFEQGDNPVKLISIGPKIYKLIQAAFASGDLEAPPYEMFGGYDFRIIKSKQGDYADYSLSKFSPKQTNIPEDMIAKIELMDLAEQRTRKIDRTTMEAMLIADQTGGNFESGDSNTGTTQTTSTTNSVVETPAQTSQTNTTTTEVAAEVNQAISNAVVEAAADINSTKAGDILAQIRARAAAKAAAAAE